MKYFICITLLILMNSCSMDRKHAECRKLNYSFYDNGAIKIASVGSYDNNRYVIDGYALTFHDNGTPSSLSFFENGEMNGLYITWDISGNIIRKELYKNDKVVGENGENVDQIPWKGWSTHDI